VAGGEAARQREMQRCDYSLELTEADGEKSEWCVKSQDVSYAWAVAEFNTPSTNQSRDKACNDGGVHGCSKV
jgi:hypothetical protein